MTSMKNAMTTLAAAIAAGVLQCAAAEPVAEGRAVQVAPAQIRAVQLDLARQRETPEFVAEYLERAADAGMNTVVLYLEDRVKTASYPYPRDDESYTPDQIRGIVEKAQSLGIDLVPVVSPLGHTERFLRFRSLKKFAEERAGYGRWGKEPNPKVVCLEIPEAREWMERYLTEVAALFPGKNFHFGFDETWDLGWCDLCRPIMEDEGLGRLFMRRVLWAHGVAQKLGKRMWMWDDFFDFFPQELERLPKDVVLCAWNYDDAIERCGLRGHFGGRIRRDSLLDYERLGLDAVVCPWFRIPNIKTIAEYAAPRKSAGYLLTQWEMETDFHGAFLPRVYAAANLWRSGGESGFYDGRWLEDGVAKVYPSLDAETRSAVAGLLTEQHKLKFSEPTLRRALDEPLPLSETYQWRAALGLLRRSPLKPGTGAVASDPLSEAALLDDLATRTEMTLIAAGILAPLRTLQWPDRTEAESRAALAEVERLAARWPHLCVRRVEQWRAWRGSIPSKTETRLHSSVPKLLAWARKVPAVAPDTEWLLETDITMVDAFGAAKCRVEGRFGGEWRDIAGGIWNWKSDSYAPAYFPKLIPVSLDAPPDALRIIHTGYGSGEICHISLRNRNTRLAPSKLVSTAGEVRGAENLVFDDLRITSFGDQDCTAAVLCPRLSEVESSATYELAETGELGRERRLEGKPPYQTLTLAPNFEQISVPFSDAPDAFTFAAEFRTLETPELIAIPGYIANAGTATTNGFSVRIQSNANGKYDLQFSIAKGGGTASKVVDSSGAKWVVGSDGAVAPGKWCRVVARWDGKRMTLDADGVRIGETEYAGVFVPAADGVLSVNRTAIGYTYYPLEMPVAEFARRAWSDDETAAFFAAKQPDDPRAERVTAQLEAARKGDFSKFGAEARPPVALHPMSLAKWLEAAALAHVRDGDAATACRIARERLGIAPDISEPDPRPDFIPAFARALADAGEAAVGTQFLEDLRRSAICKGDLSAAPLVGLDLAAALEATGRSGAAKHERDEALSLAKGTKLEEVIGGRAVCPQSAANGRAACPQSAANGRAVCPQAAAAAGRAACPQAAVRRVEGNAPHQFFVSLDGDDANPGTIEKPFRTIARAQAAARAANAPCQILVRGGRYEIASSLAFGPADSGRPGAPAALKAYNGEKVTLSGAASVSLSPVTDPAALARIAPAARASVRVADLSKIPGLVFRPMAISGFGTKKRPTPVVVEDGEALELAKHPNGGFLRVADPTGAKRGLMTEMGFQQRGSAVKPKNGFITDDPSLARFAGAKDLMVRGYWTYYWADLMSRVESIDAASGAVVMSVAEADDEPRVKMADKAEPGNPFWFMNALEAVDSPGEWYIDNEEKKLYVWPRSEKGEVSVSIASEDMVVADGVSDFVIEGIAFDGGSACALSATSCTNFALRGCSFKAFGISAAKVEGGLNVAVEDSKFADIGRTALFIGGGDRKTLAPSGHRVRGCEFARNSMYGRVHPTILVNGVGVEIEGNEAHDTPSSVLRLEGNDHLVVSNRIYRAVQECDDNAAVDVYRNPSYAGMKFLGNVFEDCGKPGGFADCGQTAIRFDGNISGMVVAGNVFRRCGTAFFGAINVNGGRMNVIDSNVFEDCRKGITAFFYPDWHWRYIFWGGNHHAIFIRGECFDNLKIREGVYAERYPGMAALPELPQVNWVTRNRTKGGVLYDRLPPATILYGNSPR